MDTVEEILEIIALAAARSDGNPWEAFATPGVELTDTQEDYLGLARAIHAALTTSGYAIEQGWRPAEQGPWSEHGQYPQYVLVSNGKHVGVGYRIEPNYEDDPEWCDEGGEFITPPVTHFRPLPAAPGGSDAL